MKTRAQQKSPGAGGGKNIAHCKSLDFTFLPFTFLPFYLLREDGGPGRGKLTLRLLGGGERFLNEGVFRCFGFDNVRTSQLQTASQEQGNGKCPCKVYANNMRDCRSVSQEKTELPIRNRKVLLSFAQT